MKEAILYGVPKVAYGTYGCTPFPMCLFSCAQYLGVPMDYTQAMAESGAAFRLTWNTGCWDGSNVDVLFSFDDPGKVFRCGLRALGRSFHLVARSPETTAEDFQRLICSQIDEGYPVIALGIIGPPEACIIAGYRDSGKTLLGWNVFQEYPEYRSSVQFAENGYFITDAWWKNPDTQAVMAIGVPKVDSLSAAQVLSNAIEVLQGRMCGKRAKGLFAYDAWKTALLNDDNFPANAVLPLLVERMMCHGDAMDCLSDGRYHAAQYLRRISEIFPAHSKALCSAAACFDTVHEILSKDMVPLLGGWERGEIQMRRLAQPDIRRLLAGMIDRMKTSDQQALFHLLNVFNSIEA